MTASPSRPNGEPGGARSARGGARTGAGCGSAAARGHTSFSRRRAEALGGTAGLRQVLGALLFPVQNCPSCAARFRGEKAEAQPKARPGDRPGCRQGWAGASRRAAVPECREAAGGGSDPEGGPVRGSPVPRPSPGRGGAGPGRAVPCPDGAGGVRASAVRARVAQNVSLANYCPP